MIFTGPKLNITEIRLVNGKGQYDGRVEIKVGGTWGTICDVGFDIYAADRICQMMGLRWVSLNQRISFYCTACH